MLKATSILLEDARKGGYSIGAFNVYNLEQIYGVLAAAEAYQSPVILQMLPKALEVAGSGLIKLCLEAGSQSFVPVAVHLDHCSSLAIIKQALAAGISSVMADGSHLAYEENADFTRTMVQFAGRYGAMVEAELGRLAGTEDDWTVEAYQACLTDPQQARDFVARTGVQTLAVCIGNVHGKYHRTPELDFSRLSKIAEGLEIPLVLHGTSGLPETMIRQSIELGVCKFNVNTELRNAYLGATRQYLKTHDPQELVPLMQSTMDAVSDAVKRKLELFGSAGKAKP